MLTFAAQTKPITLMKHLLMAAIAVMGLSAMAQTLNVNGTYYYPGGKLAWKTASGDRIDSDKLKNREIRWVAVSPDVFAAGFKMGDTIVVQCDKAPRLNGKWVIKDRMGKRTHRSVDFLVARGDTQGLPGRMSLTISKVK